MAIIIDRRTTANRDRTSENRGRLLRRYKGIIKEQLPKILGDRKLLDSVRGGGKVVIPKKDLSEPQFVYGDGGLRDTVLPGNDRWHEHDIIDKPQGSEGESGTDGPDGLDEFSVVLSREEFLKILFDDCELPFMVESLVQKQAEVVHENAGYQVGGSPNRLSIVRSYKNSKARRMSSSAALQEEIDLLETEMGSILSDIWKAASLQLASGPTVNQERRLHEIKERIEELKIRKRALPLFDTTDLRFRCRVEKALPKTHATMIMIMDNSGSMGEREKTIARKFFILLYLFLAQNYDKIDMRFISHTTSAKEMGEEEFFSTHENGGTIVSSALDLLVEMLNGIDTVGTPDNVKGAGELKGKTNVYVAQVSDGDNMDTDNGTCSELLTDDILPYVNYYAYVQVEAEGSNSSLLSYARRNSLWATYEALGKTHANHVSKQVTHERDIFGVFRSFFSTAQ